MWDPNATLGHWPRDDDVLSWRSLDTLRGGDVESRLDLLGDSDASDPEELVEVVDRRSADGTKLSAAANGQELKWGLQRQSGCDGSAGTLREDFGRRRITQDAAASSLVPSAKLLSQDDGAIRELPSTSEMVSFRDSDLVFPRSSVAPIRVHNGGSTADNQPQDSGNRLELTPPRPMSVSPPQPHLFNEQPRRVALTLGDLVAKKAVDTNSLLPPPPPPPATTTFQSFSQTPMNPLAPLDPSPRVQDVKALERRCEELADRERHLQTVLAKQLHQLETMSDQMRQQDATFQAQQLEISGMREQLSRLERQNATLQSSLKEKEQTQEQHAQLLVQKTAELSNLEAKVRSLQLTNETYQDQTRKAIEEKDKVHKDYMQVVYDLGKLQKQMNANAKETVNVAEKDLLLREIEQLRHEKDQLAGKLKESEARKSSLMQNNAVVEAQKMKELQARIRELEEDLNRARNGKPAHASSATSFPGKQTPQQPTFDRSMQSYQNLTHDIQRSVAFETSGSTMGAWNQIDEVAVPSLMNRITSTHAGSSKPMTLKDMMSDRRPQANAPAVSSTTASGVSSLASLGYSSADRRPTAGGIGYDQFKADGALARRSTSIVDVLRHQPTYDPPDLCPVVDPALSAPFATEKQTFQQDSLQKRDLEQKLLKLHVEKEQMEAKLTKVEQTGLKTMSARTEKAWLESRLRDLSLEVSRLKLSLR